MVQKYTIEPLGRSGVYNSKVKRKVMVWAMWYKKRI